MDLNERDTRVARALEAALTYSNGQIEQLKDQLRFAEAERSYLRRAIRDGRWDDLRNLLSEEDIESLCEVEPDMSGLL